MSDPRPASRRTVLKGFFYAVSIAFAPSRRTAAEPYLDRGIGGTGASSAPTELEEDRGIGGTGVIGTIQRFGSIIVNGLRISYPEDVRVSLDGEPGKPTDLKIGQVVLVVADRRGKGLSTRKIEVSSEVVGRIESVSLGGFSVLGQTVSLAGVAPTGAHWRIGDHVAVSGLRRPDGVIAASLVESRPGDASKVAGPIVKGPDGTAMLGRLKLSGVDPALIGRRGVLEGRLAGGVFEVAKSRSEQELLGPRVTSLSIEAYVERAGSGLRLGSGLVVTGGAGSKLPRGEAVRAVLITRVEGDGRLRTLSIRVDRDGAAEPTKGARPRGSNDKDGPNQPTELGGRGNAQGQDRSGGFGPPGGPSDSGTQGDFAAPGGQGAPPSSLDAPAGLGGPGGFGGFGGFGGIGPNGFGGPGGLNGPAGPSGLGGGPSGPFRR